MLRRILLLALLLPAPFLHAAEEWQSLFNTWDLTGWRANVLPESFTVVNGTIRAQAIKPSAHLFYVGSMKTGFMRFKNFILEATCRSEPNSNSGIFIHTNMTTRDSKLHLAKGYEIQLNSSTKEGRKTGSLYAVVDLSQSPVNESQWFRIRVTVNGKHIMIHLNDKPVVDYTEPDNVTRPPERAGRLIDPQGGGIALQAHDPGSVFYFKDIRIKRLP